IEAICCPRRLAEDAPLNEQNRGRDQENDASDSKRSMRFHDFLSRLSAFPASEQVPGKATRFELLAFRDGGEVCAHANKLELNNAINENRCHPERNPRNHVEVYSGKNADHPWKRDCFFENVQAGHEDNESHKRPC